MEIIFLGTSSGTPTKTRNVSALAIKRVNSKQWCLVDCGEGTQHQVLRTNLSLMNLGTIFITHVHGDHCYGLPGLLASAAMAGKTDTLTIVGPRDIQDFVEGASRATQLRLPYPIEFLAVDQWQDLSTPFPGCEEFDVRATLLSHRVPSYGYSFMENDLQPKLNVAKLKADNIDSGPLWGRIQKGSDVLLSDGREVSAADYLLAARKPREIIVAGDNDMPSLFVEAAKTADVLLHEATYTEDILQKVGAGPQHSSAKRVAIFAEDVSFRSLILTHFSPRYQDNTEVSPSILDVETEARAHYSGNLFLANDFDSYHLKSNGELIKV